MKFKIRGEIADLVVTTVVLEHTTADDKESLLLWHCPIDNSPLFQFSGRQVMIVPGMVPTKLPVLNQCPKCKTRYLVVSII